MQQVDLLITQSDSQMIQSSILKVSPLSLKQAATDHSE